MVAAERCQLTRVLPAGALLGMQEASNPVSSSFPAGVEHVLVFAICIRKEKREGSKKESRLSQLSVLSRHCFERSLFHTPRSQGDDEMSAVMMLTNDVGAVRSVGKP